MNLKIKMFVSFSSWKDLHLKPNDKEVRGRLRFRLRYYPKLPYDVEPSPDQTSGILGLKIHQAMSLQVTAAPYNRRSEVVMPGSRYDAQYPNPYAIVYLNDCCVYRTRTKLNNVAPYWNALSEHFVREWRTAIVRVVIKDHKDLEYDPVIGMVTIPLKDLFEKKEKKEVTKWYPLRHGVGCGKVRLGFLCKPLSISLRPEERGYSVGTLIIHSVTAADLDPALANCNMFLVVTLSGAEFEERTTLSNSNPPTWLDPSTGDRIQFGVLKRHRTALVVKLMQQNIFGMISTIGTATFWLKKLIDCDETEINIPIKSGIERSISRSPTLSSLFCTEPTILSSDSDSQKSEASEFRSGNAKRKRNTLSGDVEQEASDAFEDFRTEHQIYSEPQEIDEDEQVEPLYVQQTSGHENENSSSSSSGDGDDDNMLEPTDFRIKGEVKGYLRLKLYFRPALSISHEDDVRRSLTGANASVLYQNPFVSINGGDGNFEVGERNIPNGETYDVEVVERRINRLHRRRTMRQLQWVKDLVGTKVTAISGKREWEDEEIVEYEL